MKRKFLILIGEGIECEKEAERFFRLPDFGFEVLKTSVASILDSSFDLKKTLKAGDWVFFPGGFSFADHLGSGRLLAHKLREAGFFNAIAESRLNCLGFCNGFQVLVAAGFFGEATKLLHNQNSKGESIGFINRWVRLKPASWFGDFPSFEIVARHGEGRLFFEDGQWPKNVKPLVFYDDPSFDNGSVDRCAGLVATFEGRVVVALMPHPEVALRPFDHPDTMALEHPGDFSNRISQPDGAGVLFMKALFNKFKEGT